MKSIYIISEDGRTVNYGIGTYIQQLVASLKNTSFKVNVVELYLQKQTEFEVEYKDNICYFRIPSSIDNKNSKNQIRYCRNVYYVLYPYFDTNEEIVFHFNFMQAEHLAEIFKKSLPCKILLTVHYMGWSFALLGDIERLKFILHEGPDNKYDKWAKETFLIEKSFIDQYVDHVIAIANHSYQTLRSIYKIPVSKMTIISNGLQDQYIQITQEEKNTIKKLFHFSFDEKIIIFSGRLEPVKGLKYLLEAFDLLLRKNNNIRLIICGDGDFKYYMSNAFFNCSKIIFTGYISKEELYKLYTIADIGIIPSIHEEFGYVAVEMLMNGLPIIVNKTTGLSEIVGNEENGACVMINKENKERSVDQLSNKINCLLNNIELRCFYAQKGRQAFLDNYSLTIFKAKMINIYEMLF